MTEKPMSELAEAELNALVAERMGYKILELPDGRLFWAKINEGGPELLEEVSQWNPCNRPEHWWRVREWVRKGLFSMRFSFMEALRSRAVIELSYPDRKVLQRVPPFWWFMLFSNPGRAICEAFGEATE